MPIGGGGGRKMKNLYRSDCDICKFKACYLWPSSVSVKLMYNRLTQKILPSYNDLHLKHAQKSYHYCR